MKFIHGTPISGPDTQAVKFLKNRNALVSFASPQHLAIVLEVCQSLVLDNGAFKVWRTGGKLDYVGYCNWVRSLHLHPSFDFALIPDVIEGSEEENDWLIYDWPQELRGVPVWHMNESIQRLIRLCTLFPLVALGSAGEFKKPGSKIWWQRMSEAMHYITDSNGVPMCKLHGLRMMDPRIFTKLPLASADSTNVGVNVGSKNRFGQYLPPSEWVRATVIADRIESHNSAAIWDRNLFKNGVDIVEDED
jgi:hypothetical protein